MRTNLGDGKVYRAWLDGSDNPIYMVFMDDPAATPDGVLYCRNREMKHK